MPKSVTRAESVSHELDVPLIQNWPLLALQSNYGLYLFVGVTHDKCRFTTKPLYSDIQVFNLGLEQDKRKIGNIEQI